MDYKNINIKNLKYVHQICLDTESLICCLAADYFLIQRGMVPFASALYYILLNNIKDKTYKQSIVNKKKKLNKEDKVIMTNGDKNNINENGFQFDESFPFDKPDTHMDNEKFINKNYFDKSVTCIIDENHICKKKSQEEKEDYFITEKDFTDKDIYEEENEIYFDKLDMTNTDENNFQYEKTYYFDKSGLPIDECEGQRVKSQCKKIIETCCIAQIPRGFKLNECSPAMCFNLEGLTCLKNPIMQKVTLPAFECEHSKQCEVVAGYEIRAVGEVNFSLSIPIYPINGFCFPTHSHICCSSTEPVNENISHTCCPKPCNCNESCVDWSYAYFCASLIENECGSYIKVKMGVALEYSGECECDEE